VTLQELGTLKLQEGGYQEARRWGDSAAAVDPNLARAYEVRAMARLGLGELALARADIERGLGLATGRMVDEIRAFRAVILAASGDTATARREANSLVDPASISGWVSGLPLAQLGDVGRALDLLEQIPSPLARCWAARYYTQPASGRSPGSLASPRRAPGARLETPSRRDAGPNGEGRRTGAALPISPLYQASPTCTSARLRSGP
jgi:tetratricopeptide (TPR) repeat protein